MWRVLSEVRRLGFAQVFRFWSWRVFRPFVFHVRDCSDSRCCPESVRCWELLWLCLMKGAFFSPEQFKLWVPEPISSFIWAKRLWLVDICNYYIKDMSSGKGRLNVPRTQKGLGSNYGDICTIKVEGLPVLQNQLNHHMGSALLG